MKINSSEKSNEHDGMPKIILASNNVVEKIGCQDMFGLIASKKKPLIYMEQTVFGSKLFQISEIASEKLDIEKNEFMYLL
jgi:hypothetical protein